MPNIIPRNLKFNRLTSMFISRSYWSK